MLIRCVPPDKEEAETRERLDGEVETCDPQTERPDMKTKPEMARQMIR
jgi:hypothetical protein